MATDTLDLAFPVLSLAANGYAIAVMDRDALETCGEAALERGYFRGMKIVDAQGRRFHVERASKAGTVGPFGGWRLTKSKHIRVALEFGPGEQLSVDELRSLAAQSARRRPEPWEGSRGGVDGLIAALDAAESHEEIIALFQ